jgi:hypothetical protein
VPLRLLEEQRQEEQARIGGEAQHERGQVEHAEAAVGKQVQRQQWACHPPLDDAEQDQPGSCGAQRQKRHRGQQAMLADRDQAIAQRTQRNDAEQLPGRIQRGVLRMPSLGDAPGAKRKRQQAQRQVDQEDAGPTGALHQRTAQQRAQHQRQRAERDQPPIARARWRGSGNAWLRIGIALESTAHRPRPAPRARRPGSKDPAQAHSSEPMVKVATLSSHIRR